MIDGNYIDHYGLSMQKEDITEKSTEGFILLKIYFILIHQLLPGTTLSSVPSMQCPISGQEKSPFHWSANWWVKNFKETIPSYLMSRQFLAWASNNPFKSWDRNYPSLPSCFIEIIIKISWNVVLFRSKSSRCYPCENILRIDLISPSLIILMPPVASNSINLFLFLTSERTLSFHYHDHHILGFCPNNLALNTNYLLIFIQLIIWCRAKQVLKVIIFIRFPTMEFAHILPISINDQIKFVEILFLENETHCQKL